MKLSLCAVSVGAAAIALSSLLCLAADKPEGGKKKKKAASDAVQKAVDKPESGKKKILFYSASFGFRHSVVARPLTGEMAYAEKMLKEMGEQAGYEVSVTQDFNDLNDPKKYDAIVLYTTGNPIFVPSQRDNFLKWLRAGGALIGIHTATDSFHSPMNAETPMMGDEKAPLRIPDWPEYVKIIGAAFKTHGAQQPTRMKVNDPNHPTIKGIVEDGWTITDEIYQFQEKNFNKDVHLLLTVDTENMDDAVLAKLSMKKGGFYPVSWTNTEGKGRVFYTSLGHREDVWTNEVWRKHLMAGIAWALQTEK